MAYYLGRDVDIAITTEHDEYGVGLVTSSNEQFAAALDFNKPKDSNSTSYADATHKDLLFAGPRNQGGTDTDAGSDPWKGTIAGDDSTFLDVTWSNVPKNVTGLDLSFGVMDEDVAFVGQRNVLKAEIKKDNSVTLTRKKSDAVWNTIYNDARFGLIDHDDTAAGGSTVQLVPGAASFPQGLTAPDYQQCGYRVYLRFGGTTSADEIFVLRNCYVTDYSVTMGADSSQEESITLQSYIDPIIQVGDTASIAAGTSLQLLTPTAEL